MSNFGYKYRTFILSRLVFKKHKIHLTTIIIFIYTINILIVYLHETSLFYYQIIISTSINFPQINKTHLEDEK